MINRIRIDNVKDGVIAFFKMIGCKANIKNRFLSPYGIYTKPKNMNGLSFNDKMGFTLALHDYNKLPISLNDNDVILTDNKSYIHISNEDGVINIYAKDINIVADNIKYDSKNFEINSNAVVINSPSIEFKGVTLKHNGLEVGSLHTHKVIGSSTTPPI